MNGKYEIYEIDHRLADSFLQKHHYLAQQGNGFLGKKQYGLYRKDGAMVGVIVFAGVSVVETLVGAFEGFNRQSCQDGFWELTRLAMDSDLKEKNLTSWFVAKSIKHLRTETNVRALISYADSKYHHGFIYQATNFKYYGLAPQKQDFFEKIPGGGEKQVWRGSVKGLDGEWRDRSRKHRYMMVFDKRLTVKWKEEKFPKGDNNEYVGHPQGQGNLFDFLAGDMGEL